MSNDNQAATAKGPLDQALSAWRERDLEGALRWATALAEAEPENASALLVTARLLGDRGDRGAALNGLATACERAIEAGNLPLAIAAIAYVRELGGDAQRHVSAAAEAFAKGSPRLTGSASPPVPAMRAQALKPLDAELKGSSLAARAAQALLTASKELENDKSAAQAPRPAAHNPLFSSISAAALSELICAFEVRAVESGATVIEQGAPGAEAYVVARGELEVVRNASEPGKAPIKLARLGSGALFGEMALISRSPRAASVVACRPSLLLVSSKATLDEVAERDREVASALAEFCRRRMIEGLVRSSSVLRAVRDEKRASLVESFVTRSFEKGEKIIAQGQASDGLHLVALGEVAVIHREGADTTLLGELGPGEVVGEVALVLRRPATADVIAKHPTVTLHLARDKFHELIKKHPQVLAELYELAVKREEETTSIVAQEATDVEDSVLV